MIQIQLTGVNSNAGRLTNTQHTSFHELSAQGIE